MYISTYAPVQMIMFVSHDHSVLHNSLSESDLSICLSDLSIRVLQSLRYSMNCHLIWTWIFKNMRLFYSVWQCIAKTASHMHKLHEDLVFNLKKKTKKPKNQKHPEINQLEHLKLPRGLQVFGHLGLTVTSWVRTGRLRASKGHSRFLRHLCFPAARPSFSRRG